MRRHPDYRVLPLDALSAEQRSLLAATTDLSGLAALLVPVDDARFRAVDGDTLELLDALRDPAELPAGLLASGGSRLLDDIARLVMDDVLEIEHDGGFVSGPRAGRLLFPATATATATADAASDVEDVLGRLSLDAIRRAAASPLTDAEQITKLLYFANRAPVTARLWDRWPDEHAVLASLPAGGRFSPAHEIDPDRTGRSGWIFWRARSAAADPAITHKLYVSPAPDAVAETMGALSDLLRDAAPPVFKLGKDAYGLCRPDKLVIYFTDRAQLLAFAAQASGALTDVASQGVPFTCAIDGTSMVSWGVDPPHGQATRGWLDHESWRMWVTSSVAGAIVQLDRDERDAGSAWDHVRRRILVEGIDPLTWRPFADDERRPAA